MNMFLNLKLEYFISLLFTLLCTFMIKSEQQNWWKPALHVHSQAGEVALLCSPATDHHFRNIQCHGKLGGKEPHLGQVHFLPRGSLRAVTATRGRGGLGVLWAVSPEGSSVSALQSGWSPEAASAGAGPESQTLTMKVRKSLQIFWTPWQPYLEHN